MKKTFYVILIIALIMSLSACGGAADAKMSAPQSSAAEYAPIPEAPAEPESAVALPFLTPSKNGKQLVYSLNISLQSTDFKGGIRMLINTVNKYDGYVEAAQINGRDYFDTTSSRNAVYTIRIPIESFSEFLVVLEENYNVVSMRQISEDLTSTHTKTSGELDALLAQKAQMEEALKKETSEERKLELQQQLTDLELSIAANRAEKNAIDDAVAYSTATVELIEVFPPEEQEVLTFSQELNRTTQTSGNNTLLVLQKLLLLMIMLLPVVVVGLLVLLVLYFVRPDWIKKLRRKKETPQPEKEDTQKK